MLQRVRSMKTKKLLYNSNQNEAVIAFRSLVQSATHSYGEEKLNDCIQRSEELENDSSGSKNRLPEHFQAATE